MEKAVILGIGRTDTFTYLVVRKEKSFFLWLNGLLKTLDLTPNADVIETSDRKGTCVFKKKRIKDSTDRHETYGFRLAKDACVENTRIDVFYGNKKVFVLIHTPVDNDAKVSAFLESSTERYAQLTSTEKAKSKGFYLEHR